MKKPEEIIMAIVAALWVILTYFVLNYFDLRLEPLLTITGFTALWAIVTFVFWQKNLITYIWPIFLGLLVACWWPVLDWISVKDIVTTIQSSEQIEKVPTWYNSWGFKFGLSGVAIVLGYVGMWKFTQKRKQKALKNQPLA